VVFIHITFSMTSFFSRVMVITLLGIGLIATLGTPTLTYASTVHPGCTLTVTIDGVESPVRSGTKISIREGVLFTIAWVSHNADKGVDRNGKVIALAGSTTTVVTSNTNYLLRFSAGGYQSTCTLSTYVVSGSVTTALVASSSKPITIAGRARGLDTVSVSVTLFGTTTAASSKNVSVRHGVWTYVVPQKLADGLYYIAISSTKSGITTLVATSTLNIGNVPVVSVPVPTTIVVVPVPLLIGGVAHPGATIAVAYLQIINIGLATTTIQTVSLTQSGTAPVASLVGLTAISDNGVAKGSVGTMVGGTPFIGSNATIPLGLVLAPQEMRLVTIKAIITTNVLPYLGTKIMLLVSGVGTNARIQSTLPLFGTVWTLGY
jgi:hypothetical protein